MTNRPNQRTNQSTDNKRLRIPTYPTDGRSARLLHLRAHRSCGVIFHVPTDSTPTYTPTQETRIFKFIVVRENYLEWGGHLIHVRLQRSAMSLVFLVLLFLFLFVVVFFGIFRNFGAFFFFSSFGYKRSCSYRHLFSCSFVRTHPPSPSIHRSVRRVTLPSHPIPSRPIPTCPSYPSIYYSLLLLAPSRPSVRPAIDHRVTHPFHIPSIQNQNLEPILSLSLSAYIYNYTTYYILRYAIHYPRICASFFVWLAVFLYVGHLEGGGGRLFIRRKFLLLQRIL
ncbi:hypothetical protein M413DRAFT_144760 [Hebeloma cylindrosporum]|uniref:Uncharacterized protein n=1 Tax=Hebeloma cylindrosporum TaxID=76867 RepID=A0A0C2XUB0_HEBCY|nr:hypothetical protein M413DRAFT_144760 [Hebeloma cylindrosporum h7]